jgi:hypothetical protein
MSQSNYPTKEEILRREPKLRDGVMNNVNAWKRLVWANRDLPRMGGDEAALKSLLRIMNIAYDKLVTVEFLPQLSTCYYQPKEHRILMNSHSIISLLHEYGHAIYGASELYACRFSVHIFKNLFPRAYAKLEWNGHMLVKHKV